MTKLKNIHPGEILLEEFLIPFNITTYQLAKDIAIPQIRISEIVKGNRIITAEIAIRFSKYFGNSAKFWLGLQNDFNIEEEKHKSASLNSIKRLFSKRIMAKTTGKSTGKRTLIAPNADKRYVRRDENGRFTSSDDQGKSLSRDVKQKAKTKVKPGYGDQGDQKKSSATKRSVTKKAGATKQGVNKKK